MVKIIIGLIFLIIQVMSMAGNTDGITTELTSKEIVAITNEGFLPESGSIKINPATKSITNDDVEYDNKYKEFLQKGFYHEDDNSITELLQMHDVIQFEFKANVNTLNDPADSHMKHTPEQVGVGYDFKPVPADEVDNLIGFAAAGTYITGKGWDSIGEFFENKKIGTCHYHDGTTKLTYTAAQVSEEYITYDVNNKVTMIDVKGTPETGYLYTISWYSKDFFRELQCANRKYSKSITDAVITLANKIDIQ